MKISIITAAFRVEHMTRVAESIKRQAFQKWEWIIVNDGQEEIREWYQKNKGIVPHMRLIDLSWCKGRFGLYARNIGAMAANYRHIVFLDDDNEWESDHLSSLVGFEERTGKTPYCWMHYKGKKPGSTLDRTKKTGFSRQGIDLGCMLYRKEYFEKHGYIRDDAQVTFDWNMIERIVKGEGVDNFICTRNPSLIFWHKRY